MSDNRVYIHELVDITGPNRAKYMHHITANWSPIGQAERGQLCFGIWGTVGSTGRWPQVVNLWEYGSWSALADNFEHEFEHATLQDPSLASWWNEAASFRSGGFDRVLVAAPWSPSITELIERGVRGVVYAHDIIEVAPGASAEFLAIVRSEAIPAMSEFGATLAGAFETAMCGGAECVVLWAFPSWQAWGDVEAAHGGGTSAAPWNGAPGDLVRRWGRTLMVDAPLSPMRIGRQPAVADRGQAPT